MRKLARAVSDVPKCSGNESCMVVEEELLTTQESLKGLDAVASARRKIHETSHDLREGRERYRTMKEALMKLKGNLDKPYGRSVDQIRIHRMIMQNSLAQVYPNFKRNADAIMWEHETDQVKPYVLVGMPRRTGKTQTVAMFVAAYLVAMPPKKVVIFSQTVNTSREMLKRVAFYGEQLAKGKFIKAGQDRLFFSHTCDKNDPNNSEVIARPSGGDNNRGMGGDLIIAEEVEYMSLDTIDVAIAPAMSKEDTILLAITSNIASKTTSVYRRLADTKDSAGRPMFHEFRVQKICEACDKAGLQMCPHNANRVPPWISRESEISRALMSSDTIYRTEILGVTTDTETRCFSDEMVDTIFESVHGLTSRPLFAVVSIDPSGGRISDTGIVTIVVSSNGTMTVRFSLFIFIFIATGF